MTQMPSITIRIDEDTAARVDELATALDRSRAWVANSALESYLEQEKAWLDEIQSGTGELDRGEGFPHDEVMSEIRKKIADHHPKIDP